MSLLHQTPRWTRRHWLNQTCCSVLAVVPLSRLHRGLRWNTPFPPQRAVRAATHRTNSPETDREALAQNAVAAAIQAGAHYADARLTRTVQHRYDFGNDVATDNEEVGVGVRALVDGYWGFSAVPSGDRAAVEQLAQQAVGQAKINAQGAVTRTVDLGSIPAVTGHWATPISIDPFTVSVEEKHAMMRYWNACARKVGLAIDGVQSELHFIQQERVVVTSAGARFTQVVFESGGKILIQPFGLKGQVDPQLRIPIREVASAGRGWELFLDAKIPDQIAAMPDQFVALDAMQRNKRPATVGRYTLVCDGATMAALVSATLGGATQIDRALGYEANARGTSFLDDPLNMLGTFKVGSPHVTVTANRSAPGQLATVKWDDEGVAPREFPLVKDGLLVDFQTNREQAAWLEPYYRKLGRPIQSNGCATSEDALGITLQQTPNLSLEPGVSSVHVDDLVANVPDGIFMEGGTVMQVDSQMRNGLLFAPTMRRIQKGRLGPPLEDGAVQFNTLELWRNVQAVGGPSTCAVVPFSQYPYGGEWGWLMGLPVKGDPPQLTSYSVRAAAALIANQPLIDPERKG